MNLDVRLAADQLARMRGMTAAYHRQFFSDTTVSTISALVLFIAGWAVAEEAFLLIPIVALVGAVRTAFDASYLMFARWYSRCLEDDLNRAAGRRILIASEIESSYLFELGSRKVVTVPLAGPFSWFTFVTIFYTASGIAVSAFAIALGWEVLFAAPAALAWSYLIVVAILTAGALAAGSWWFIGGEGERRLQEAIESNYEPTSERQERTTP